MKKEDIKLSDLERILFGDAPPAFMLEVLVRSLVIFFALFLTMKLLGKRMTGQLNNTDMGVLLTLGAIISVPMQIPERGILQGFLVLLLAVIFQRGLNLWAFKRYQVELLTHGAVQILVRDGTIEPEVLKKNRLSKHQVFAVLRNKNVFNLGTVKRLYLEARGTFTLLTYSGSCEGLSIYPQEESFGLMKAEASAAGKLACVNCGTIIVAATALHPTRCPKCKQDQFIEAIKSARDEEE